MTFAAWIRQPTTINGIATLIGAAAASVAGVLTHSTDIAAAAAAIAYGAVHVVMPDNSAEAAAVQKLVSDAVHAAVEKRLSASLPTLIGDGTAVLSALAAPAGVTTVSVQTAGSGGVGGALPVNPAPPANAAT